MKKFYSLISLLIFLVHSSIAQEEESYQYFDGADTIFESSINIELDTNSFNVWQIGEPQKNIFDHAATLPNAIVTDTINNYPINNTSRFTIKILNQFNPYGILALQWQQKLDMDGNYDGGIVEFTTDNGLTWENAFNNPYTYSFYGFETINEDTLNTGEYAFSGTDTNWRDIWLCFDLSWMSQFPDTMMLRFTLKSDSLDNAKEGWMIDNMMAHYTYAHTLKEANRTEYIIVYPNPANNIIHVNIEKLKEFHIIENMELVNSLGIVVESWKNIPTKFWFDISKFDDGRYFLKVKTNIKSETIPIIINKN